MFPMLMFPVSGSVMERLERRQRYADAMRKAMRRYYGHLNDACADMNVKPSNLDAALNGDRGLPVGFLEMPLGFMAWWAILPARCDGDSSGDQTRGSGDVRVARFSSPRSRRDACVY
jgi:hypothetical protein